MAEPELSVRGLTDEEAERILEGIQQNITQAVTMNLVQGKAFPEYVAIEPLDWLNILGVMGEHNVDSVDCIGMECLGREIKLVCATKDVEELEYEPS